MLIPVPYRSQWDDDAHLSIGDCGIVSACMMALWCELPCTPDGMIRQAGLEAGKHSYFFDEVTRAAGVVGLKLSYHDDASWEVIKAELDAGRPVITLLRYGEISGNLDKFVGQHFWVVVGYAGDNVIVNDPDFWVPHRQAGIQRQIPLAQFQKAIGQGLKNVGVKQHQALFLQAESQNGI